MFKLYKGPKYVAVSQDQQNVIPQFERYSRVLHSQNHLSSFREICSCSNFPKMHNAPWHLNKPHIFHFLWYGWYFEIGFFWMSFPRKCHMQISDFIRSIVVMTFFKCAQRNSKVMRQERLKLTGTVVQYTQRVSQKTIRLLQCDGFLEEKNADLISIVFRNFQT